MVYYIDLRKKRKKKKEIKKNYRIRFLDTNKFDDIFNVPLILKGKSYIVIETEKGEELVKILGEISYYGDEESKYKFLRKANKKDFYTFKQHELEANKALRLCKNLAEKFNLKMNLLKAYIPLNRSKILFYYVSESRVDFRELVRELAKRLKLRIEMRQVGVRDGVQILGAVGICGNTCCCNNFMDKFETVNIEMIEEQNLPPIPSKFTGICGRLMCCLSFEKENYEMKGELPPVNSTIEIDGKIFNVKNQDFIREIVELVDEEGNKYTIPFNEIKEKDIKIIKVEKNCDNCSCNNNINNFLEQNYEVEELKEE
ncbi:MAG: hypothetical protein DSY66_02760 [Persephonella sp.]|nr:MAG: hypothetical protein DSY66_02760 [Persephonella sp.]